GTFTNANGALLSVNAGTYAVGGPLTNSGTINMGGGSALTVANLQNSGTLQTPAAGTLASITVAPGGSFTNGGSINLQNGSVGDRLTINGNYVGAPGSRILLDFATLTSSADQLVINGNTSGTTGVFVLNLTPGAPFTASPVLVQVNGAAGPNVFTLANAQNFGAVSVQLLTQNTALAQSVSLSLPAAQI